MAQISTTIPKGKQTPMPAHGGEHDGMLTWPDTEQPRRLPLLAAGADDDDGYGDGDSGKSSTASTCGNIVLSIVGAGVLGLPYTFKRTGWAAGLLILAVIAAAALYGMLLIVWSKRAVDAARGKGQGQWQGQGQGQRIGSLGSLGQAVYGSRGRAAVDGMVVLSMLGVCVGYLIFIADTLPRALAAGPATAAAGAGARARATCLAAVCAAQALLSAVRSVSDLAPLSVFAAAVDAAAKLAVVAQEAAIIGRTAGAAHVRAVGDWAGMVYGVGVATYAFEGATLVVPLELAMRRRRRFGPALAGSVALIVSVYAGFGAFGYLAFGEQTQQIVTLNLGGGTLPHSWLVPLLQVALCVNLFFTFPLMMNPAYEVLERRLCAGRFSLLLRCSVVALTSAVALLVPSFTDFLSLIGSSVGCALGFVLPSLFHLRLCWHDGSARAWIVADCVLFAFGVVFGIYGTLTSLVTLLRRRR